MKSFIRNRLIRMSYALLKTKEPDEARRILSLVNRDRYESFLQEEEILEIVQKSYYKLFGERIWKFIITEI